MCKKRSKGMLLLILSTLLCLPLALFCVRTLAGGTEHKFEATESEPSLISSADELIALAARVNSGDTCEGEHFLLTQDIFLNDISSFDEWSDSVRPENIFVPIGDGIVSDGSGELGHSFCGVFDGGGHSITGAYIMATGGLSGVGLFGVVSDGEIRNLTVDHCYIPNSARCVGGLVGRARRSLVEGCSVSGRINGVSAVGAIAGEFLDGSIIDCTASAHVQSELSAGMIAGSCGTSLVSGCRTLGTVSSAQYLGGIAGIGDHCSFEGCISECVVLGGERAGGIVGFCFSCNITGCTGSGSISCADYGAGIAGASQDSFIRLCRSEAVIDGERYLGGAAGRCCGTEIVGFINSGSLSGEYYVGGVAGWSDNGMDFGSTLPSRGKKTGSISVRILLCRNDGSIGGEWGIGGIVGDCHETEILDCYNTGEVVSLQYAGGVTGYTADCVINRCYNAGSVSADQFADALIGRNSMDGTEVADCCYLDTSCAVPSEHGASLTHEQLLSSESYPGFDFETVWLMDERTEYPYAELRALNDAPSPVPGDLDGDGRVTAADAVLALRASMGLFELDEPLASAADMDGDGLVSVADAVMILRHALGTI